MSSLDDARSYIQDRFGPTYAAWMQLDDTTANQTLVSAADYFHVLPWQGTATGTLNGQPTTFAWPRTGVFVDGVEVDSTTVPSDVLDAWYQLAVLLFADPTLPGKLDQGSNVQSVGGGGVPSVSFFAPTSARQGTAPVVPVIVLRLVGKYLAAPSGVSEGGFGQAGRGRSEWSRERQFTLVRGEE